MIVRKIIDTFYDLAKQHKLIRSFAYDRVSKGMGTGEKQYPQFFLEDPMHCELRHHLSSTSILQLGCKTVDRGRMSKCLSSDWSTYCGKTEST